jgi:hypothetical protein
VRVERRHTQQALSPPIGHLSSSQAGLAEILADMVGYRIWFSGTNTGICGATMKGSLQCFMKQHYNSQRFAVV